MKKTAKEYLMKYVKLNEETGCWEWQGPRQQPGKNPMHPKLLPYGLYHHNNERGNAHRKSWEIHYGEIPQGMLVMHSCDVAYCCNPQHLVLGTHTANMRDKVAKGRCGKKGKPNPRKLNSELVREIRKNEFDLTTSELALTYGVSYLTIKHIQDGISWKNV
jgi:hypothetical protein